MFQVRIQCPVTGKDGIVAVELARGHISIPPYSTTRGCPSCGQSHAWRSVQIMRDARPVRRKAEHRTLQKIAR